MQKNLMRCALTLVAFGAALALNGCGSSFYTVGGTVSGLTAKESVTLLLNGGEAQSVGTNGVFAFSNRLASAGGYDVTVKSHPPGVSCAVSNGSGMGGSSNVINVGVSCAAGTETVLYSFGSSATDGSAPLSGLIMDGAGNLYGTTSAGGTYGLGTVFKISPNGTETVLHAFAGGTTDGQFPLRRLVMDSAGNLYGTTALGGANDLGTVFKISAAGTETVLYSFAGKQQPSGGLIMDGAGNLYGTTSGGGANDDGTVFKIGPNGTETVLYSFGSSATDGSAPLSGLIMDGAGNLYGTTAGGGANDDGTVFKIGPNGTETILHSFAGGTTDGARPEAGLIMDSAGNLYGTTLLAGVNQAGTVFKIDLTTGTETVLYSFSDNTTDGADPQAALIMDSAGNLYGTTVDGGANNDGTVFKISPNGTETVLHSFADGTTDGAKPQAALIVDSAGDLFGTTQSGGTYNGGTVFKIN